MGYEKLRKWKTQLVRMVLAQYEQELRTEFGWKLERGGSPGQEEPGQFELVLSLSGGEDKVCIDLNGWAYESGDREFFERELHAEVEEDREEEGEDFYVGRLSAKVVDRLFWWSFETENVVDWRMLKKLIRRGVTEEVAVWLEDHKMRARVFNVFKCRMGPPVLEHSELCWKEDSNFDDNWGGWEVYAKDGTLQLWVSPWTATDVKFEFKGDAKRWPTLERCFIEGGKYPALKAVEMLLDWVCPLRLADQLNALTC